MNNLRYASPPKAALPGQDTEIERLHDNDISTTSTIKLAQVDISTIRTVAGEAGDASAENISETKRSCIAAAAAVSHASAADVLIPKATICGAAATLLKARVNLGRLIQLIRTGMPPIGDELMGENYQVADQELDSLAFVADDLLKQLRMGMGGAGPSPSPRQQRKTPYIELDSGGGAISHALAAEPSPMARKKRPWVPTAEEQVAEERPPKKPRQPHAWGYGPRRFLDNSARGRRMGPGSMRDRHGFSSIRSRATTQDDTGPRQMGT